MISFVCEFELIYIKSGSHDTSSNFYSAGIPVALTPIALLTQCPKIPNDLEQNYLDPSDSDPSDHDTVNRGTSLTQPPFTLDALWT